MKKELIIILGGMIVRDDTGVWRSLNMYDIDDTYGIADDELRAHAAAALFTDDGQRDQRFLVSGGKGQYSEVKDALTVARVVQNALLALGIPRGKITLEEHSGTTLSQLREVAKLYSAGDYDTVRMITNEYHIPRVETMLHHDRILKKLYEKSAITILSAEEILLSHDPDQWRSRIEAARADPAMAKRLASEEQGVKDFMAGKYKSQTNHEKETAD